MRKVAPAPRTPFPSYRELNLHCCAPLACGRGRLTDIRREVHTEPVGRGEHLLQHTVPLLADTPHLEHQGQDQDLHRLGGWQVSSENGQRPSSVQYLSSACLSPCL